MDYFIYKNGELFAENVAITEIAKQVGTPFYVYSTQTLTRHFHVFEEALSGLDHMICYAVKANSNIAVLKHLGQLGAGMDVVSGGEFKRAIAAGISGDRVVFSGVGKLKSELRFALEENVRQINVESEVELAWLNEIAISMGVRAPIALRINPDVDAKTHEMISTGKADNKFGIAIGEAVRIYQDAAKMKGINIVGIDVHIGSQLTDLKPYSEAFDVIAELTKTLRSHGIEIKRLDIGGGLGIPYKRSNDRPPLPMEYGKLVKQKLGHLNCEIEIEPGRLIVGNAGLMVSRIILIKEGPTKKFMVIDAGMNDLIRPAIYNAHHEIIPIMEPKAAEEQQPYDVVGPICETGDTFTKDRLLPEMQADDLVAFRSAGAYGAVMASEYNSRPLIPEVLVNGSEFAVIRKRRTIDAMISDDKIPSWLD